MLLMFQHWCRFKSFFHANLPLLLLPLLPWIILPLLFLHSLSSLSGLYVHPNMYAL